MPNFSYVAIDKEGKKIEGKVMASSEKDARKILRGQGAKIKTLRPPTFLEMDLEEWMADKGLGGSFGNKELLNFTKQLSTMINAGVPILQTLEIMYKQESNRALKMAIKGIFTDVGEGKTVAESMSKQKGFSKLYVNLVKAGEAAGILDEILEKLTIHIEKQEKIKSQIKSAMTYPAIVVVIGFAVIYCMMVFIVPKFQEMITDTGQEMPWITQMVIDISKFMQDYSIHIILGFGGSAYAFKEYIKTPTGKKIFDTVMMKAPLFGGIIIKGSLCTFTRTLATMLSSGVPLTDALTVCIDTIEHTTVQKDLQMVKDKVVQGKTMSEPIMRISYFPPMVAQMVKIGESTGTLDSMLDKVSEIFENEVSDLVNSMTKLIEPIVMVVLGGIVAVVLIAMYLPIFMTAGGGD
jgi:type IV pilus assembly protein PilC